MPMDRVRLGTDVRQNITARERLDRSGGLPEAASFRDRLASAHAGKLNERIDRALSQIEELGGRLGESFSFAELRKYKQAIAGLFKDLTSNMLEVKTELEWDSQAWEHRTLVTIRKVDAELEKLSDLILDQEQDRMAILAKIGEIKGMLVDVRM